jgi:hypothetical protein
MTLNTYIIYEENITLDTKPMTCFPVTVPDTLVGELLREHKHIYRPPSTGVTVADKSKYFRKLPIKKDKLAYLYNIVHCAQICIQHLLLLVSISFLQSHVQH